MPVSLDNKDKSKKIPINTSFLGVFQFETANKSAIIPKKKNKTSWMLETYAAVSWFIGWTKNKIAKTTEVLYLKNLENRRNTRNEFTIINVTWGA